ncbi:hypothetical protein, partial [Acinetobacter tjernbergiae]|uniref:hypothetical protein n=1 Tax=Acinetobacter tjernbergiae TaxID=202955 RepID=UPI001BB29CBF
GNQSTGGGYGFLSCLHGSEHFDANFSPTLIFLSCLHGSEHHFLLSSRVFYFLSCLHGSEL